MSDELNLRQYVAVLKKRLILIILTVFIASGAAASYSLLFQDPVYEASTKIIVNQTTTQQDSNQLDINQINSNIMMINTYKEIIKTPAILDKVVVKYSQLGLTAKELSDKIQVNSVNNTQVMTLVVRDVDYRKAAEVVNAVSNVFQEEIPHIFKVENVSILNEAVVTDQPKPVSPNVGLNIVIAFVVSLMIAVGISFLMEYLDDTIKSEDDVMQYLGQPTLAMISRVNPDDIKANQLKQTHKAGELERVSVGK